MGGLMGGSAGGMDDIDRLLRQRSMDDLTGVSGGGSLGSTMASSREPNRTYRVRDRDEDRGRLDDTQRDLTPVSMVHKRSPYADIPRFMTCTCRRLHGTASRNASAWRFSAMEPGIRTRIPMDLPVGPDYVVGPGRRLSINLWGGVSQRMVRRWIARAGSICRKPDRCW